MKFVFRFLRSKYIGRIIWLRALYWSFVFSSFGKKSRVLGSIVVIKPENITIGNDTSINHGCFFNARTLLSIGNHVHLFSFVIINTGGLDYCKILKNRQHIKAMVVIEDGVWVGSNAIINPGVVIGKNSVIGSGAVVTKDIPADSVAVGVPAKVIKSIYS